MTDNAEIRPYRIDIPQRTLDDLNDRLARVRWADDAPNDGYGISTAAVKALVARWRDSYDWRQWEAALNAYPQFTTEIDGQNIHFLHARSSEPGALPLILTHGWPGSVVEFLKVIGPLTDPAAHGGDPADAFHLVIPSLPGFAFSGPTEAGWGVVRTARAWARLMARLGYNRYGAAGNDAGSMISPLIGRIEPEPVVGVHVTQVYSFPSGDPADFADMSADEMAALNKLQWFMDNKFSFNQLHSQQPQTIAHALADSPVGLLGWNLQLMEGFDEDFILTNTAIYWLTNTGGSSIRFYYEDAHLPKLPAEPTTVPMGVAGFADDFAGIRRFAERDHSNLVQWHLYDEPAGHYAAYHAPQILVEDMQAFYRKLRRA